MNRNDVKKFQQAQLELLDYVHNICVSLGLNYYLMFGTLLGAIRHKGFIPWDVDIDIAMPRNDYDTLSEYLRHNIDDRLFFDDYSTEKNHIAPHCILRQKNTKIVYNEDRRFQYDLRNEIYIDIFPIDVAPNNKRKINKMRKKIAFYRRLVSLKLAPQYGKITSKNKATIKKIVSFLLKPITFYRINSAIDRSMKEYNSCESDFVGIMTAPEVMEKLIVRKEVFGKPRKAEFEGREFYVPEKAEDFLTFRFGNYNELPPETERWHYVDTIIDHIEYDD